MPAAPYAGNNERPRWKPEQRRWTDPRLTLVKPDRSFERSREPRPAIHDSTQPDTTRLVTTRHVCSLSLPPRPVPATLYSGRHRPAPSRSPATPMDLPFSTPSHACTALDSATCRVPDPNPHVPLLPPPAAASQHPVPYRSPAYGPRCLNMSPVVAPAQLAARSIHSFFVSRCIGLRALVRPFPLSVSCSGLSLSLHASTLRLRPHTMYTTSPAPRFALSRSLSQSNPSFFFSL